MSTKFGPYIFVSYSSKNKAEADAIRELLKDNELESWMAPYDIPAGEKYAYVIDRAREECACVLLLLSKDAQDSDHVDREIERAISYKKEIIPIRLDGCELNAGFRYYLSNCQITNITDINAANPKIQDLFGRLRQLSCAAQDPLEPLLSFFRQWAALPQKMTVNDERARLLEDVYNKLLALLKKEGYDADSYSITIEQSPLETVDVSISFVCEELMITDTKAFYEIIRHLDNFVIYPLLDNTLRFAGVMRKVFDVTVL